MKCLFAYNPLSGKGKIKKKLSYIESKLKEKFDEVEIYATKCPKDMVSVAKNACGKYDYLIFSGGDGSFNEVANGLSCEDNRPILGYIPSGTVNDIARSLKLPRSIKKAVDVIVSGEEKEIDVMKLNEEYAIYVVAAGAFTGCSYKTKQSDKKKMGKLAYAKEVLQNELKLQDFNLTVETKDDSITTNCEFILILNTRSVGSFPINKKAVLDDGLVDVVVVKQVVKPNFFHKIGAFFRIIGIFLFGYHEKPNKHYIKLRGSDFVIKPKEDLVWNYDGEEGATGILHLNVLPKHLKILCEKRKKK